jgi:hypothetical protein
MGDIAIHYNVVFFNDSNSANLIIVILLVLHLLRASVVLLGLNDVPTEHLWIFYFDLRIIENVIVVVYVFYDFYWLLLLALLFWL